VGGQHHAPAALLPERPSTHCIGGWVSLRAGLERCGKSRPPPGLDARTVQPVASSNTDYAIPEHILTETHAKLYSHQLSSLDFVWLSLSYLISVSVFHKFVIFPNSDIDCEPKNEMFLDVAYRCSASSLHSSPNVFCDTATQQTSPCYAHLHLERRFNFYA
jgi:hypothetical protein